MLDEKVEIAMIDRGLVTITCEPRAIGCRGDSVWKQVVLADFDEALEGPPAPLLISRRDALAGGRGAATNCQ
jgi:hypothetical protein